MIGRAIGSYEIVEKIGEGGMGAVYRGMDRMLEREVAIKSLRPELASQPAVVERFRAEAKTLARLNHPNIATLYSFLREGEDYFMVMEFVRGKTFYEILKESGPMQWNRAVVLFGQALEGIDHAHRQGIIHRDIKPANIMVSDASSIKVMDFGIARALGSARMTKHGLVVGTLEYISPEQVRGLETDARSDIYSLGVLLYELLTGRVPFASENDYELMRAQIENAPPPPRTLVPEIPLIVEQAIMRALAKRREARYETAGEFRAVLMGTLGAVTNPLERTSSSYAAPKTRALTMPVASSETVIKAPSVEPRDSGAAQGGGFFTGDQFNLDKSTRANLASEAGRATDETDSPQTEVASRPLPQSKLNRKHYIAAAIIMLALAIAVVAWMRSGQSSPAPTTETAQPAASPQPADNTSSATEQPAAADESAAQPDSEAGTAPAPEAQEEKATAETDSRNGNRTAQSRKENTNTAAVEETPTETPAVAQPETTQPPAVTTEPEAQPSTPPAQENDAASSAGAAVKKEEKKGGGFGGFMKRIFGGKKQNSNTAKDKKKP